MKIANNIPKQAHDLLQTKWAIVDFETTGVDAKTCEPVSIAIKRCDGVLFQSLIKPPIEIPDGASRIHGIYDKDVKDAPTFADLHIIIYHLLDWINFIAYNVSYDANVLAHTCSRNNVTLPRGETFCAMKMASEHFNSQGIGNKWRKLGVAAKLLDIELDANQLHGAMYDVQTTHKILLALASENGE